MKTLVLDHLAVTGHSRDAARAHIEDSLGLKMQSGGAHEKFATHNHLLGLENGLYLEAISIDPDAVPPNRPRWFDIDNFEGPPRLTNWICAVPNLMDALKQWPDAGSPVSLERGALRWEMTVTAHGALPFDGMFPPLITWKGDLHPMQMLAKSGAALVQLTVLHPDAAALSERLGFIDGAEIRFEDAQDVGLVAEFDTPHGRRVLT